MKTAIVLAAALLVGCGGGSFRTSDPVTGDDAGVAEGGDDAAMFDAGPSEASPPQEASVEAASACFAQGAPCFFQDGGSCCDGLFCQSAGGSDPTPRCEPGTPICLIAGTPCEADGGGYPCCDGLKCEVPIGTHAVPAECLAQ